MMTGNWMMFGEKKSLIKMGFYGGLGIATYKELIGIRRDWLSWEGDWETLGLCYGYGGWLDFGGADFGVRIGQDKIYTSLFTTGFMSASGNGNNVYIGLRFSG